MWQGLLTTYGPYSGRGARTVARYEREQELLNEIMLDEKIREALHEKATVVFLDKHQFDIWANNGGGSSACTPFNAQLIQDCLDPKADLDKLLRPNSLEGRLLREVKGFADKLKPGDGSNGGEFPMEYMTKHCKKLLANSVVSTCEFVGDQRKDMVREALREMVVFDRAALLLTALPLSNTKASGEQTGDTFTVLWLDPKFIVIESHRHFVCDVEKGALVAQIDDIDSLVQWLYEALFPIMRCSCEWFTGIRILPTIPRITRGHFKMVATACQAWTSPLRHMYDVGIAIDFQTFLKKHWQLADSWLQDALFFYAHQLRFSALVAVFQARLEDVGLEEMLGEAQLIDFLKNTWPHLQTEWLRIRPTSAECSWDPQFRAECKQVPPLVRRQLGLYAYGVASWSIEDISWRAVGGALVELRGVDAMNEGDQYKAIKKAKEDLLGLQIPNWDYYQAIHKIRTWLCCNTDGTKLKGWFFGNKMSAGNKTLWKLLGSPSTDEFKTECLGWQCDDLECGLHLCGIGCLAAKMNPKDVDEVDVGILADFHKTVVVDAAATSRCYHLPVQIFEWAKSKGLRGCCKRPRSPLSSAVESNGPEAATESNEMNAAAEQAMAEQAATDQAATDQASAEQAMAEQVAAERAAVEHAAAEQAVAEQAVLDQASAEQAAAEDDAADQAGAEQAASEHAASEQAAQPKAKALKRKKEEDVDVAVELLERIPKVYALRREVDQLVSADDMLVAAEKKHQLVAQVQAIIELPVCMRCWIEAPSAKSRFHLHKAHLEHWKFQHHHMVCGYCAQLKGVPDGSKGDFDEIQLSLRRRVHAELLMAHARLPTTCPEVLRVKFNHELNALRVKVGQGRGMKKKKADASRWGRVDASEDKEALSFSELFASQVPRTLERLLPEAEMLEHRAALLLALRALELR